MSDAQKAEATETTVKVKFGRHTYTIDPAKFTIELLEADEQNRILVVARELLGPEQFETFKSRHTLATDLAGFRAAALEALGNSEASPDS